MIFSTYLGGAGEEIVGDWRWRPGTAVGETRSADFPIVGGVQATYAGLRDGFAARDFR